MISREQARVIASEELRGRGLGGTVQAVLLLDEMTGARPNVYNVALEECWIAYVEPVSGVGLRSSEIVVINRQSGAVLYCGSANDEG